jgi:hypothetical protein
MQIVHLVRLLPRVIVDDVTDASAIYRYHYRREREKRTKHVRDTLVIASIGYRAASCIVRLPRDDLHNDGISDGRQLLTDQRPAVNADCRYLPIPNCLPRTLSSPLASPLCERHASASIRIRTDYSAGGSFRLPTSPINSFHYAFDAAAFSVRFIITFLI